MKAHNLLKARIYAAMVEARKLKKIERKKSRKALVHTSMYAPVLSIAERVLSRCPCCGRPTPKSRGIGPICMKGECLCK